VTDIARSPIASPLLSRPVPRPRRYASLAAFLSFLFPGAGQLYNRQRLLALLLGLPVLLLVLVALAAWVLAQPALVVRLFDARFLFGLVVLNALLASWRLVAILQAHAHTARLDFRHGSTYMTALLVIATVVMHAIPAMYSLKAADTLRAVSLRGAGEVHASVGGSSRTFIGFVGPSGEPLPEPSEQPAVHLGERVNVLLVGIDTWPGREESLTDTMMVVSLDPDGDSAMLSVPRDLYNAPLPDGTYYENKLNALLSEASADPERFPLGGVSTLKATISELLGVPVHYFAAIDFDGFQQTIDSVGGVDVEVERPISDPEYEHPDSTFGLYIPAGAIHMDGSLALAYARSRQGEGDSDFTRAARQQQLLTALREKLADTNLITTLPGILDAVQNTIQTDIPERRIPQLAQAIQDADMTRLERAVIEPPLVEPATADDGAYILLPDYVGIRELGQRLLGG
jgi:LCP family protein required for cell wall assembly